MALNPTAHIMGNDGGGNEVEIGIANLPRHNEQFLAAVRLAAAVRGNNRNHNDLIHADQKNYLHVNLVSSLPAVATEGHLEVVSAASAASNAMNISTNVFTASIGNAILNRHK